jgi:hypothetical protein
MAPPSMRGALNILFQLATTIGIFVASLINWGALLRSLQSFTARTSSVVCTAKP